MRVVVRNDISDETDINRAGYSPIMDSLIGKTFTIDRLSDSGNVTLKGNRDGWWFSLSWLDEVKDEFFEKELFEV